MNVAVLMSTYNGGKFLKEQIDSILSQEGDFNLDLWVRDDGSTDSTNDILKSYESDGKLTRIMGKNLGPAKSFLAILSECKGYDYYAFADQDDYWMPKKISKAISKIENIDGPCVYFSNADITDSNLAYTDKKVYKVSPVIEFKTLTCAGGILGCTMVFNRKLQELLLNGRSPNKVIMHDFYVAEVCLAIGGQILYDDKSYIKYRQHNSNVIGISSNIIQTIKNRFTDIIKKQPISIAEQAFEVISNYNDYIDKDKQEWLRKISRYRASIKNRIELCFNPNTHYLNTNMSLKIRISILLGNR